MLACQNGHVQCARALIDKGANVNHSINDGRTALMQAAKNGHDLCVLALIKAGADAGIAHWYCTKCANKTFNPDADCCQNSRCKLKLSGRYGQGVWVDECGNSKRRRCR